MTWVNRPGSLWSLRLLACCACLLAMPAYAVVLDFENLGDGITRAVALRSASAEYAALGVSFSGGGGAPGQPVFRGWNSLSSLIAKRPPAANRFLLSTFQQRSGAYLDIVVSFATPVSAAEGDVVFNPTVTASAIAYDANGELVDQEYFASGRRIGSLDTSALRARKESSRFCCAPTFRKRRSDWTISRSPRCRSRPAAWRCSAASCCWQ